MFQAIDATIAQAVKNSLLRHLWYLTESLVVLALFDGGVDLDTKSAMANALRAIPRPQEFHIGKPTFPRQVPQGNALKLERMVGPNTWMLFSLLGNDGDWLMQPPQQWITNPQYLEILLIVQELPVVNDAAERGVKDIQDYANMARDADDRGRMILVSNSHRMKLPKFLKNEMEENM